MMKSTTFIKVMVPVMRFTKLLRLIKFARPPARLPLSKLPTKHPHFTGEQHLGIIPLVSLGSSLDFINCPCFSCFSTPAEDLSWSRGTSTFANLSTWHKSTEMIPNLSSYKKLSLQFIARLTWTPVLWPYIWKCRRSKTSLAPGSLHSALLQDAGLPIPSNGHRLWTPVLVHVSEQFLSFSI